MKVTVKTLINTQYNANTYLLKSTLNDAACYLIDIGNWEEVIANLETHQYIKAIFVTHSHYDHICGIHKIVEKFPTVQVYCSAYTKRALADSKMNLSFYHQTPITYEGANVLPVKQDDCIALFDDVAIEVVETPGHNEGSLSFKIEDVIFTGDSLIPEYTVVTKLKSGNKILAERSILKIRDSIFYDDTIYPGHGQAVVAHRVNWDFYFTGSTR
ncbi:MBL fold metallo-hydrolase [Flavobacterium lacus]|uniref:Glyoxylase-like metal-dependent hydrolase (Beta-lactamase superfamily II) n=1 Tax=Flavobacterium lacus TaxID=1353778 RepID=A0A328WLX3_9FLAO|nr:MBL fold metallo-hydrolase [Flavobacterium lacus]RAR47221.1 glyoxylase-like metal-dependent hydrolase (beta-lactamase superfamily II) [Flavobacterium lacus]